MNPMDIFGEGDPRSQGLFIFNVKSTQMTPALVKILRYLLIEKAENGVVFSIDRPSTFLRSLLEHQGVPQQKLMYLDAVSNISGELSPHWDKRDLFTSPFCTNLFPELVCCKSTAVAGVRNGFVAVDNLGALQPYMTDPCVEKLVRALKNLGGHSPDFKCIVMMDKGSSPGLFDILSRHGAREVSL
jgi:hypothetical protein